VRPRRGFIWRHAADEIVGSAEYQQYQDAGANDAEEEYVEESSEPAYKEEQ